MDRRTDSKVRQTDRLRTEMDRRTDSRSDRQTDSQSVSQTDRRTVSQTDKQADGRTDSSQGLWVVKKPDFSMQRVALRSFVLSGDSCG